MSDTDGTPVINRRAPLDAALDKYHHFLRCCSHSAVMRSSAVGRTSWTFFFEAWTSKINNHCNAQADAAEKHQLRDRAGPSRQPSIPVPASGRDPMGVQKRGDRPEGHIEAQAGRSGGARDEESRKPGKKTQSRRACAFTKLRLMATMAVLSRTTAYRTLAGGLAKPWLCAATQLGRPTWRYWRTPW